MRALLVLCTILLTSCATQPNQASSSYGASVGIVNHTDKFIYSAAVNGAGGANMPAWGTGMANVCCAMVPKKWYPGMVALVEWDMPEGSKHIYKQQKVEVEQYSEPGSIYLHFYPEDKVRVIVSPYDGASPLHPIPRPKKPTSPQNK